MNATKTKRTFKMFFSENDIRRITLGVATWDGFTEQLQKLYAEDVFHPELRIQYVDNEGDKCTLSSSQEWDGMLEQFGEDEIIKLYVSEGVHQGRYFKDGPPPEVQELYIQTPEVVAPVTAATPLPADADSFMITVPNCLQSLFPSRKILPYNLPTWMQPHVKITKVPDGGNDVYMDIDVYGLFEELHRQALSRIGPNKKPQVLEKAKAFLESMLSMVPEHPLALYNLACTEALLGRAEAALKALKGAVVAGYANLTHLQTDPDLDNIRSCEGYQELVEQLGAAEEAVSEPVKVEEAEAPQPVVLEPVPTPPKEEEVEETKSVIPPNFKWPTELQALVDMGFDVNVAAAKLQQRKGRLDRAINDLLLS